MQYLQLHFPKYYLFALSNYTTQDDSLAVPPGLPEKTTATPAGRATAARPADNKAAAVYSVGDYRVGDTEDTLLNGHPDIRY
ncbi:hypothetical protein LGH70_20960 [Hymenobacter sp. BT635]|uniref:Uncharacterized protein n=1 Tax=Hymenobacter nitidus TaxID=2880929 RepID=A0ABS8AI14_9BACT|nr:hypothetical protein [Hymenobacter nitidus]MCB2380078.1 hypothetical protein [Hymenobacter nitidus]